ncbi:MAG: hypothetical protein UHI54_04620, partial [Bifidobacterium merycicum]|uniref:hypothetical protein n=1 Tax=Bifidobacterium merycicum TaxID=78345 RepID=UPI002E79AF10
WDQYANADYLRHALLTHRLHCRPEARAPDTRRKDCHIQLFFSCSSVVLQLFFNYFSVVFVSEYQRDAPRATSEEVVRGACDGCFRLFSGSLASFSQA